MTEERMTGKDKRAEEQALFIAWLTSLTDEEWEMFRDNIAYFQNTLAGLPVAVAVLLDLEVAIDQIKEGNPEIRQLSDTRKRWEVYIQEVYWEKNKTKLH